MQPTEQPIPEKFLDKETGELNSNALLKSYLELERKLSERADDDKPNLLQEGTRPENADGYDITIDHSFFAVDADLNKAMFERGFTLEQAQFVYDMAGEKLIPMIVDLASEYEADRETQRLITYFGGQENWQEVSRQLSGWGRKNLADNIFKVMASNYDGILAMYKMMKSDEPKTVRESAETPLADEDELNAMMRDPRYWRDRDPAFVKKVTDGFRTLYKE